jgi:hypothetical protein
MNRRRLLHLRHHRRLNQDLQKARLNRPRNLDLLCHYRQIGNLIQLNRRRQNRPMHLQN